MFFIVINHFHLKVDQKLQELREKEQKEKELREREQKEKELKELREKEIKAAKEEKSKKIQIVKNLEPLLKLGAGTEAK